MEPRKYIAGPLPAGSLQPQSSPDAFILWHADHFGPISSEQFRWQQEIYARAMEQTQSFLAPSLVERDWLGFWN